MIVAQCTLTYIVLIARGKSGIMLQHGHRSRSLCNRIYYGAASRAAGTHVRVPLYRCTLSELLSVAAPIGWNVGPGTTII